MVMFSLFLFTIAFQKFEIITNCNILILIKDEILYVSAIFKKRFVLKKFILISLKLL